jgi:hypothetical protein
MLRCRLEMVVRIYRFAMQVTPRAVNMRSELAFLATASLQLWNFQRLADHGAAVNKKHQR